MFVLKRKSVDAWIYFVIYPLKYLNICALLNVQGLVSRNINKLQSDELIQIFRNNHIVLLTESWLEDEANVQVNGFQHFQLNRTLKKRGTKRESGGIIAYVRDELVTDTTLYLKDSDDVL